MILIALLVSSSTFSQERLNGARVSQIANAKDSLLVLRSSVYYSAVNANETGFESIYNKWVQDDESKKKYYPLVYEAWKLCIDKCPEQLNLYLDGILLHRWMIQSSQTTEERERYFDELMNVWDLRADNAELINANVRNKHLQTSGNSIRMNKISDWRTYSPYAPKSVDSMYVACYDMYLPIINDIRQDIGNGKEAGNDLNTSQLLDFFNSSFSHYANEVNKIGKGPEDELYAKQFADYQHDMQSARDEYNHFVDSLRIPSKSSIRTQAQADVYNQKMTEKGNAVMRYNERVTQLNDSIRPIKERNENRLANLRKASANTLLDHYQMIKLIADNVNNTVGEDSISNRFNELIAYCQSLIRNNAHLDDNASTIDKIIMQYGDSIRLHTNDYAWLNDLVSKFRYSVDFDSTDPDFVNVVKLRDQAYEEMMANRNKQDVASAVGVRVANNTTKSGRNYGQLANNAYNRGRSSNDARYFVLAYHYYNKALKDNPTNSSYKTYRGDCLRFIRSEGFFQGLKKGSVLSFSGESMIVP